MLKEQRLPRGIRNNNPLNLRITNTPWQGKKTPNTDGSFEQFESLEMGIRAAMVNIRTMIRRDRLDTIEKLIPRWAPASDGNNENSYIFNVCKKSGIGQTERLVITNKNQICRLVWAMAFVENGTEISFGRVENAWARI